MAKQLAADEDSKRKLQRLKDRAAALKSRQLLSAIQETQRALAAAQEEETRRMPSYDLLPGDSDDLKHERGWCVVELFTA